MLRTTKKKHASKKVTYKNVINDNHNKFESWKFVINPQNKLIFPTSNYGSNQFYYNLTNLMINLLIDIFIRDTYKTNLNGNHNRVTWHVSLLFHFANTTKLFTVN